jgi:peptidoglycan/LPS O-acetylase OafA/YrhL
MDSNKRIDALTGIRGFAALLVVYAHLTENGFFSIHRLHPGEVGVMVFFTLSGFLMSYLYCQKPFTTDTVLKYAVARFSRIAPAYLTVVVASFLICRFIDPDFVYSIFGWNFARHILFSGNVSALWSIPPEVQFYAVFVGIWFAVWRAISQKDFSMIALVGLLIAVVMGLRVNLPGTFVGSMIHYFFIGVVFGLIRNQASSVDFNHRNITALQVIGLALIVLVVSNVIYVDVGTKKEMYNDLLPSLFAGLFIFVFSFPTLLNRVLFENRALQRCGEWSFSIYLLNLPIIYVAQKFMGPAPHPAVLAAVITVVILVCAYLCFRLIETPGGRWMKRQGDGLIKTRFGLASLSLIAKKPAD